MTAEHRNPLPMDRPAPDPIAGLEAKEDIQEYSQDQMESLRTGFVDRAKTEQARFKERTDSEHWFAVCFDTRAQKERFLQAMNWIEHGDKYLDGRDLADQHGIELPEPSANLLTSSKVDKKSSRLAFEPGKAMK